MSVPEVLKLDTGVGLQLANKLNNAVEALGREPLPVFVQVNTSGEDTKYGLEPDKCTELAQYIRDSCKHLKFAGLMTIGQPDYSSKPENFEVRRVLTPPQPLSPQISPRSMLLGSDGHFCGWPLRESRSCSTHHVCASRTSMNLSSLADELQGLDSALALCAREICGLSRIRSRVRCT